MPGKETRRKGTRGKFTIMTSSSTRPSCIYCSSLLSPSPPLSFLLLTYNIWKAPGPPSSPAGTCRTVTGISAIKTGLLLPPSTCFSFFSSALLASSVTAKQHNQKIGMTAMLPKSQNIQRFLKSPGFNLIAGSKLFTGSKIMTESK